MGYVSFGTKCKESENKRKNTKQKSSLKHGLKVRDKMSNKSTKATGRGASNSKKRSPGRDEKGLFASGNKFAEKWSEEKVLAIGKQLLEWMKESEGNFWLEDFLHENDLYVNFINSMSARFPRFKDYIARAKEIQESRITKFALLGNLDTGMARWVLSVHHNKRDVAETKTELSGAVQTVDRFTLKIENN